jgi:acetyl-CoA C-acetyltransferase
MHTRVPVIIGVGEITDRSDDLFLSQEPLALMVEALRQAESDSGTNCIARLDSIDIVHQVSWRYEKTAQRLCERLGIRPARAVYGVTGGESPMRYLHESALRIARGESEFAAVVGAEAQYAANKAKANNVALPWTPIAKDVENPFSTEGRLNTQAIAHGAIRPIHVYPFYENAAHVAWGQSPREALFESGELWSRFSAVAAANPYSWSKQQYSAEEVIRPTDDNRTICFPYTKRMVANPAVNQGAALILTTLENARALKVDESKLIFVLGGAAANEPRDYLQRDQYGRSDAQDVVLSAVRELIDQNGGELQALELYSCFPCVPKMTRRVLGLPVDVTPTVTGGLSFFGAPLNNYMTHSACAMVRHLRAGKADTGVLYGQGEFVTKHHTVAVSRHAPRLALRTDYGVQLKVDSLRGPIPSLQSNFTGNAVVETHTVVFDRTGEPMHGVVIARSEQNRFMARVAGADRDSLAVLMNAERSPIGVTGRVSLGTDGLLHWHF